MYVCILYIDTSLDVEIVVYVQKPWVFSPPLRPNAVSTHKKGPNPSFIRNSGVGKRARGPLWPTKTIPK